MSMMKYWTTHLNVSPFGRNNKGQNIAGVEEAAKEFLVLSASKLTALKQLLLRIASKSNCILSHTAKGTFERFKGEG